MIKWKWGYKMSEPVSISFLEIVTSKQFENDKSEISRIGCSMTNVYCIQPRLFLHQHRAFQIVSFLGAASAINFRIKNILWNRKFGLKSSPGTLGAVGLVVGVGVAATPRRTNMYPLFHFDHCRQLVVDYWNWFAQLNVVARTHINHTCINYGTLVVNVAMHQYLMPQKRWKQTGPLIHFRPCHQTKGAEVRKPAKFSSNSDGNGSGTKSGWRLQSTPAIRSRCRSIMQMGLERGVWHIQ